MHRYIIGKPKAKRSLVTLVTTMFVFAFVASLITSPIKQTEALSGSQFNPGRIIDDSIFYNKNAMTAAQIQRFLDSKVPVCDTNHAETSDPDDSGSPYTCLKDYRRNTSNIAPESGLCNGYSGASNESAAQIIYKVAQSCGINPQVILVMLQKEQSLVTDTWPWNIQYQKAMGAFCPDTAPCDSGYAGFFKQVYFGAHRFKVYAANPDSFNYKAGRNNTILWHPNAGCGTSTVYIQNQATASLYIYTPYRPNKAALDNLYGTGNGCSSYGNRNFWRLFNDWFGSTVNGSGLRLISCSGQKYAIEPFIKRKRALTPQAIEAWGFEYRHYADGDPGCSYPAYTETLGRVMRSRTTGKLYIVDKGKFYQISNQAIASAWGIGNINQTVAQINGDNINSSLNSAGTLPRVATSDNPDVSTYYLIDSGNRHAIAGTPSGDTDSLRLIRGYNYVPAATLSVSLLQTLTNTTSVNYSFKVGSAWYLLDHGKVKKIDSSHVGIWDDFLAGPQLSSNVLTLFPQSSIGGGFERNGYYYRVIADSKTERTSDKSIAKNWVNSESPNITQLLTSKVISQAPIDKTQSTIDGNVRLISCGGKKYLVERFRRIKRELSANGETAWGFSGKYYMVGDRGCSYPTYAVKADTMLRSRNTGKVYYIDMKKAYYVHSQAAADDWGFGNVASQTYPQFDPDSILDNLQVVRELPPAP